MVRMHSDEIVTDADLVRQLIAVQFPQWSALPVEQSVSSGTDNAIYRLGTDLVVRMPRRPGSVEKIAKDARWLPYLEPLLPLPIPAPVVQGAPTEAYPWDWAVYRWLDGVDGTAGRLADTVENARALAALILALQRIDPTGGPTPGAHNNYRGSPVAERDAATRRWFETLQGTPVALVAAGLAAVTAAWDAALAAAPWDRSPVWQHGDLLPGNLLVDGSGRLTSVIDWGCLAIGDPAWDVVPAWSCFTGEAREAFRSALGVDDATWLRARGWAVLQGAGALAYYYESNPTLAGVGGKNLAAVIEDMRRA